MQLEGIVSRDLCIESQAATGAIPGVHDFVVSGSQGGLVFAESRSGSLGASPLSFERAIKTVTLLVAFGATATFTADPVLASTLAPTDLEVPGGGQTAWVVSSSTESARMEVRSFAAIVSALDDETIEDGITHRAEGDLARHLNEFGAGRFVPAIQGITAPGRAASVLKLLGRSAEIPPTLRAALVTWGLASNSTEIRDATVQAVENWQDRAFVALLRAHHETVPWLGDYAASVVRDLEE